MEQLFNDSNRYAGIEGMWNDLPEEVKISDPKVDACVAKLYIERESDGLIYDVYFGGPDKESYHATDLSFVGESYLLYTTAAVEVSGRTEFKWAIPYNGEYLHHGEPRGFDINSPGGWNWTHVIANGLSEYIGWSTAWPDWAIMEWSAHAIYDE
jgi:hypothetical protein